MKESPLLRSKGSMLFNRFEYHDVLNAAISLTDHTFNLQKYFNRFSRKDVQLLIDILQQRYSIHKFRALRTEIQEIEDNGMKCIK